jgi:nucleoside-diphosphate-sugar epimerase
VRRPDITLARTALGWEPKVEVRHGLRRTIDYFRDALDEAGGTALPEVDLLDQAS